MAEKKSSGMSSDHFSVNNSRYENFLRSQSKFRGNTFTATASSKLPPVSIRNFDKFRRSTCKVSPAIVPAFRGNDGRENDIDSRVNNVVGKLVGDGVGGSLMSTTAHLLSLLETDDDIENFTMSNNYNDIDKDNKGPKVSRPTFHLFGNNGSKIVREILASNGWIEAPPDVSHLEVKLIWSDNLLQVNVWDFREGQQLLNHVPNVHLLSNKISLLRCLQDFNVFKKSRTGLRMVEFVPETYRLDLKSDRLLYCQQHKPGELWICKPAMLNQGKGIFLVRSSEELCTRLKRLETEESERLHFSKPVNVRLIQRYIPFPLLLNGRKADIRAYMLLASVRPFVVLFREGYVRLSCNLYDLDNLDPQTHLTNQCMQRRNPLYSVMKEETVWGMDRLNDHVVYNYTQRSTSLKHNWVRTSLQNQMCRIMLHCFHAVKAKLDRRTGLFELLGFDFLVDASLKVWLLEINTNSSLEVNCLVLHKVIPSVLEEAIDISLECFEKSRRGVRILPLQSIRSSVLLYCEEMPYMKTIPKTTPPPHKKR